MDIHQLTKRQAQIYYYYHVKGEKHKDVMKIVFLKGGAYYNEWDRVREILGDLDAYKDQIKEEDLENWIDPEPEKKSPQTDKQERPEQPKEEEPIKEEPQKPLDNKQQEKSTPNGSSQDEAAQTPLRYPKWLRWAVPAVVAVFLFACLISISLFLVDRINALFHTPTASVVLAASATTPTP